MFSRRSFLASSALASSSAALAPAAKLGSGAVILFQGDSITDAGRMKDRLEANDARAFGRGYPFLLASRLLDERAGDGLQIYNRGISGNKVPDLAARWQADCLDIKPDLLSILIGVNDIWHKLNGRYDGTVDDYEKGYTALLEQTKQALPDVRLVICQPFVLRCGAVNDSWFPEFDQRKAAAERVAKKAGATWVPFQEMFDEALERAAPEHWAADGVHPTMAGHHLMAKTWMEVVKP
ncbi:MAG: SGNH/GDSL hydrolase family protein [Bryobacterales bacterium]|nr:SGNH/GDSL hydrolase family protein [Bryobacterales bacterium]